MLIGSFNMGAKPCQFRDRTLRRTSIAAEATRRNSPECENLSAKVTGK